MAGASSDRRRDRLLCDGDNVSVDDAEFERLPLDLRPEVT